MTLYPNIIDISYTCPHCGEMIGASLDPDEADSEGYFEYIEDCSVCCSPIVLSGVLQRDAGDDQHTHCTINARRENE